MTLLNVVPGESIGQFKLGTTLFSIVNYLRAHEAEYRSVQIAITSWTSELLPVVITSPPLILYFNYATQRLVQVQVTETPEKYIKYKKNKTFNTESSITQSIMRVLGPAFEEKKEDKTYLFYPGVTFELEDDVLFRCILTPSNKSIPLESAYLTYTLPPVFDSIEDELYKARIHKSLKRVDLEFYSFSKPEPLSVPLELGKTTYEDVLALLGNPVRSFWKEDDRLALYADTLTSSSSDYFLSYPQYGVTLLLNSSNKIIKVILHSNLPGEANFGRTARCLWDIDLERTVAAPPATSSEGSIKSGVATPATDSSPEDEEQVEDEEEEEEESELNKDEESDDAKSLDDGPGSGDERETSNAKLLEASVDKKETKTAVAESSTYLEQAILSSDKNTYPDFVAYLAPFATATSHKPMTLDRSVGESSGDFVGKRTELYAYNNIAFECTIPDKAIETLWLF